MKIIFAETKKAPAEISSDRGMVKAI